MKRYVKSAFKDYGTATTPGRGYPYIVNIYYDTGDAESGPSIEEDQELVWATTKSDAERIVELTYNKPGYGYCGFTFDHIADEDEVKYWEEIEDRPF